MKNKSRRNFMKSSGIAAAGAFTFANSLSCTPGNQEQKMDEAGRNHPLSGIKRENIKITDVTVTPFSYEDPKGNLWRHNKYMVWKTDGCLTQVFTDQGIIGI